MSLKRATLIALIAVGVHFLFNLPHHLRRPDFFPFLSFLLWDGGVALFFAVLYSKQK